MACCLRHNRGRYQNVRRIRPACFAGAAQSGLDWRLHLSRFAQRAGLSWRVAGAIIAGDTRTFAASVSHAPLGLRKAAQI